MRASQRAGLLLVTALVLGHARADAEMRVFVTNEKSDDVTVIDAATRKVLKTVPVGKRPRGVTVTVLRTFRRSAEHTSELQSTSELVFRPLIANIKHTCCNLSKQV